MARPSYKSEKRKKELARQKKQEEKRLRRFNKAPGEEAGMPDQATLEGLGLIAPTSAEAGDESEADDDGAEGSEGAEGTGGPAQPSGGSKPGS